VAKEETMLGDKINELTGKITGTRVLPRKGGGITVEVSFAGQGKLLGVDTAEVGTYESNMTPAGVLNGKGQGFVRSNDGDALMWTGAGVGKPTGKGLAATWRYTWIMQTTSSRWSRLNGVLGVGEWEVDENGNGKAQLWEWK
jgi:hypothetical protein